VQPGVFIPRPETEGIVEAAVAALRERQQALGRSLRLLDLGTGSGCVAISLALALPACVVVGVELSWEALRAARRNVLRHELGARVRLIQGSWLEAVRGSFDGVVTNPPYVPDAQVDHLPLDVRQEPRLSLDGGRDGLREIERLLQQVPHVLAPGGLIALECGEAQAAPLLRRLGAAAWCGRAVQLSDLADRPRGILAWRTSL
jgi:release factor glutamine methyltransferase